jgi:hypothetical protein
MAHTKANTLHWHCPCELQQVGPHIGLYCKPHRHWLKWLTREETKAAVDLGTRLATKPNRDPLSLKDNHTIDKRRRRNKRWQKYKANKGTRQTVG